MTASVAVRVAHLALSLCPAKRAVVGALLSRTNGRGTAATRVSGGCRAPAMFAVGTAARSTEVVQHLGSAGRCSTSSSPARRALGNTGSSRVSRRPTHPVKEVSFRLQSLSAVAGSSNEGLALGAQFFSCHCPSERFNLQGRALLSVTGWHVRVRPPQQLVVDGDVDLFG